MTKAFGYMRVSGKGQADGDGFDRQRIAIEGHAKTADIEIVQWFQDVQTGKDEWQDRPGWAAMMTALNGTRTVLVEKLDRVARAVLVQELILKDLEKREVRLLTSTGEDTSDESPERTMFRQLLALFAQYERASIVAKLRGARERMKAETGRCEGRVPYGQSNSNGIIREGEQEALALMKQLRDAGHTTEMISLALGQKGFKTRTGSPWRGQTVAKILRWKPK